MYRVLERCDAEKRNNHLRSTNFIYFQIYIKTNSINFKYLCDCFFNCKLKYWSCWFENNWSKLVLFQLLFLYPPHSSRVSFQFLRVPAVAYTHIFKSTHESDVCSCVRYAQRWVTGYVVFGKTHGEAADCLSSLALFCISTWTCSTAFFCQRLWFFFLFLLWLWFLRQSQQCLLPLVHLEGGLTSMHTQPRFRYCMYTNYVAGCKCLGWHCCMVSVDKNAMYSHRHGRVCICFLFVNVCGSGN